MDSFLKHLSPFRHRVNLFYIHIHVYQLKKLYPSTIFILYFKVICINEICITILNDSSLTQSNKSRKHDNI